MIKGSPFCEALLAKVPSVERRRRIIDKLFPSVGKWTHHKTYIVMDCNEYATLAETLGVSQNHMEGFNLTFDVRFQLTRGVPGEYLFTPPSIYDSIRKELC